MKNGKISLNLLRSTVYPDPDADRGRHRFTYAVYPHPDRTEESKIVEHAYNLNREVRVIPYGIDVNMFKVIGDGVIIDGIHMTEDGKVALRLYEYKGKDTVVAIDSSLRNEHTYESDLLYDKLRNTDIKALRFKGFEIKTILFEI